MIHPAFDSLEKASRILREGGVVIYPTETFYALGASVANPQALDRIYELKKRPRGLPLLCLVEGREMVRDLVARIPQEAELLMGRFWPGPLTLVLPAKEGLHPHLVGTQGGVAVRQSPNPIARLLVQKVGSPVVGTSANLTGCDPAARVGDVPQEILAKVDFVLDGGALPGGVPSTILDCTAVPFRILREGVISREELLEAVEVV